jgi:FkbM family methyltransferase
MTTRSFALRLLGAWQWTLSRVPGIPSLARLARNQAGCVVARAFRDGFDPRTNGEARLLAALAPSSPVLVDVGANVGKYTSAFLAQAPASAHALLFEPSESAGTVLAERFGGNPRVEIVAAACGDEEGTSPFHEEPGAGVTSSVVGGHSRPDAVARTVRICRLDHELERRGLGSVDLLKIDAEGADLAVLRGAKALLERRAIRVVQFEYNAPWRLAGASLGGAIRLLEAHDYRVFLLRRRGLVAFDYARWGEFFDYANFVGVRAADADEIVGKVREATPG